MPEERRLVTILFADIVGSTQLASEYDAEVVRASLDRAFAAIEPLLTQRGATVEKFIGDAVLAVFGIPMAHDDDADRAVRGAFAVRDAVGALVGPLPLEVRIGVNTGEVVTGLSEQQRLVTGLATNLAQRLQAAAPPGGILVGELTHRMTRGGVDYDEPRQIEAKGIGSVTAYPARTLRSLLPEQHRGLEGWRAPLIGRDDELRILVDRYHRLSTETHAHLATLFGPPGAGKSRLASEFAALVGEANVRRGRCLPYGEGITFFAVQQICREDAHITLQMSRDEAVERLRAAALAALDGFPDDAEPVARRLLVLNGYGRPDELLGDLPAPAVADELRWAFRRYFECRAREQPLVLIFEDIHWAEPGLLDLIDHLAEWARAPLFILCLARPELVEKRPSWGAGKVNATAVALEPLTSEEIRRLIDELLVISAIDERLRHEVIERADGNPLYVEELLRTLIETGHIERRDQRWVAMPSNAPIELPPTLHALIAGRLDRAPSEVRRLLQLGSIAGREFSSENAKLLLGDGQLRRETFEDAIHRDLIVETREQRIGGGRVYRFKHALVRDVAYASLPKTERSHLHDRYGRWLEAQLGDRITADIDVLAYHSDRAWTLAAEVLGEQAPERARRAFDHLTRAATLARLRGDVSAAVSLYERAVEAGEAASVDPRERANASGYLAIQRLIAGFDPSSLEVLNRAIVLAEDAHANAVLAELLADRGLVGSLILHEAHTQPWFARAVELARTTADDPLLGRVLNAQAFPAYWAGDFAAAEPLFRELIVFMRERGLRSVGSSLYLVDSPFLNLAGIVLQRGAFAENVALLEDAGKMAEASGSRIARSDWLFALAWSLFYRRQYDEALAVSEQRLAEAREIGSRSILATEFGLHATLLLNLGRAAEARVAARETISRVRTAKNLWRSFAQAFLARALLLEGDMIAAEAAADEAIAAAPDTAEAVFPRAYSRGARAAVHAARRENEKAEERWREAIRIVEPTGWRLVRARLEEEFAHWLIERGRAREAVSLLEAMLPLYADPLAERPRRAVEALLNEGNGARVG